MALGAGLLVGVVNGLFVVLLEIDSLIVTLGMSTFVSGIVLWISDSNTVSGISNDLVKPVIIWRFAGRSARVLLRDGDRCWPSSTRSATCPWAGDCWSWAAAARWRDSVASGSAPSDGAR